LTLYAYWHVWLYIWPMLQLLCLLLPPQVHPPLLLP
jgi:hypothetical protein